MILLYSCPADPLDLELSIDLLHWLNEQGLQCEWLVNCESLSDVLWYGSPLKVMHVAATDFDKQLRSLKPKFLIVDGLPFGSKGECYEAIEKVPSMWIARRLHWTAYLKKIQIENPSIYDLSLILEPLSPDQMAYVKLTEYLQIKFPALEAGALTASTNVSDSRKWLLLPSLDANQIAQQGGYAMELIEKERQIPHLLDVAEFEPFQLPLSFLVNQYQRVIGGCSYSAACLALQWIGKDLNMGFRWVDQCDTWDDQAGRLQAIRKRAWLKKDQSDDWKLWIQQHLESRGVL